MNFEVCQLSNRNRQDFSGLAVEPPCRDVLFSYNCISLAADLRGSLSLRATQPLTAGVPAVDAISPTRYPSRVAASLASQRPMQPPPLLTEDVASMHHPAMAGQRLSRFASKSSCSSTASGVELATAAAVAASPDPELGARGSTRSDPGAVDRWSPSSFLEISTFPSTRWPLKTVASDKDLFDLDDRSKREACQVVGQMVLQPARPDRSDSGVDCGRLGSSMGDRASFAHLSAEKEKGSDSGLLADREAAASIYNGVALALPLDERPVKARNGRRGSIVKFSAAAEVDGLMALDAISVTRGPSPTSAEPVRNNEAHHADSTQEQRCRGLGSEDACGNCRRCRLRASRLDSPMPRKLTQELLESVNHNNGIGGGGATAAFSRLGGEETKDDGNVDSEGSLRHDDDVGESCDDRASLDDDDDGQFGRAGSSLTGEEQPGSLSFTAKGLVDYLESSNGPQSQCHSPGLNGVDVDHYPHQPLLPRRMDGGASRRFPRLASLPQLTLLDFPVSGGADIAPLRSGGFLASRSSRTGVYSGGGGDGGGGGNISPALSSDEGETLTRFVSSWTADPTVPPPLLQPTSSTSPPAADIAASWHGLTAGGGTTSLSRLQGLRSCTLPSPRVLRRQTSQPGTDTPVECPGQHRSSSPLSSHSMRSMSIGARLPTPAAGARRQSPGPLGARSGSRSLLSPEAPFPVPYADVATAVQPVSPLGVSERFSYRRTDSSPMLARVSGAGDPLRVSLTRQPRASSIRSGVASPVDARDRRESDALASFMSDYHEGRSLSRSGSVHWA